MKKNSALFQSLLFGVLFTLFDLIFKYFNSETINPLKSLIYFSGGCGIGYLIYRTNKNSGKYKKRQE